VEQQPSLPAEPKPGEPLSARLSLNGFRQIIFQPSQAFAAIAAQEKKKTWVAPVVLVAALIVITALISTLAVTTPVSQRSSSAANRTGSTQTTRTASSGNTNRTTGGQTQGGQAQAIPLGGPQGAAPQGAPPNMGGGFVNPMGGGATTSTQTSAAAAAAPNVWLSTLMPGASFLITWALLGALTNLLSLAFGGHGNSLMAMNIAAWASIPLGVRSLMQMIYYLATGNGILEPGLSGFAPTANGNTGLIFLQHLLSRVDVYLFWEMALLALGVGIWGGLTRKKAWGIALIAIGLIILLQSLLGLGLEALGGLNLNTSMLTRLR
jgi:hypothetical protein